MAWPKNNKVTENNYQSEVQQLKTELSSLKSKLNKVSDTNQKTQLENKLSSIENKINKVTNHDKSTIEKLDQEIKEFKKKLEEDKPEPNNNNKKKEAKLRFVVEAPNEKGEISYCFNNFLESDERGVKYFYISKNHPQIKKLLSQGKLQERKQFIIRYEKADSEKDFILFHFNEFNTELEIIEV